jgi:hypothetical protein
MTFLQSGGRWIFGILLILHGFAHLPGVLGSWNIGTFEDVSRRPNILLQHASEPILYLLGLIYLVAGVTFIAAGFGLLRRASWWLTALAIALPLSFLVTILWWRDAILGLVINTIVLMVLAAAVFGPQLVQQRRQVFR